MQSTGLPDAREKFAYYIAIEHDPMRPRRRERIRMVRHTLVSWGDLHALGFNEAFVPEIRAARDRVESTAGPLAPHTGIVLLAIQVINPPRLLVGIPYLINRPMV